MRQLALVSMLITSAAFAQEIGSEVEQPAANKPGDPPPAPPAARAAAVGPASAGKGQLGIRATFFGSPTTNLPTAAVGVAFFISDLIKLTVDGGMALTVPPRNTGGVTAGFSVAAGLDVLFRTPAASARPFLTAQVGFGKLNSGADDFAMVLNVGGGGEYFFSQFFSMNVRGLISMPINFRTGALGFLLFTPGVGATVYF